MPTQASNQPQLIREERQLTEPLAESLPETPTDRMVIIFLPEDLEVDSHRFNRMLAIRFNPCKDSQELQWLIQAVATLADTHSNPRTSPRPEASSNLELSSTTTSSPNLRVEVELEQYSELALPDLPPA